LRRFREPARVASLDEVRAAVERDVVHDRAQRAADSFYQRLQANYSVRIEGA
jgi:hypothetical protein